MPRLLALSLLLLALPAVADELPSLTVDEVASRVGKPNVYIFDVNSQTVYKNGHLPGARWAMYDRIDASTLPPDKDATLIFYCANEH
jgi:rhodanese-related sulfurtransferase